MCSVTHTLLVIVLISPLSLEPAFYIVVSLVLSSLEVMHLVLNGLQLLSKFLNRVERVEFYEFVMLRTSTVLVASNFFCSFTIYRSAILDTLSLLM